MQTNKPDARDSAGCKNGAAFLPFEISHVIQSFFLCHSCCFLIPTRPAHVVIGFYYDINSRETLLPLIHIKILDDQAIGLLDCNSFMHAITVCREGNKSVDSFPSLPLAAHGYDRQREREASGWGKAGRQIEITKAELLGRQSYSSRAV